MKMKKVRFTYEVIVNGQVNTLHRKFDLDVTDQQAYDTIKRENAGKEIRNIKRFDRSKTFGSGSYMKSNFAATKTSKRYPGNA